MSLKDLNLKTVSCNDLARYQSEIFRIYYIDERISVESANGQRNILMRAMIFSSALADEIHIYISETELEQAIQVMNFVSCGTLSSDIENNLVPQDSKFSVKMDIFALIDQAGNLHDEFYFNGLSFEQTIKLAKTQGFSLM